jgi:hypothetical protein
MFRSQADWCADPWFDPTTRRLPSVDVGSSHQPSIAVRSLPLLAPIMVAAVLIRALDAFKIVDIIVSALHLA